MYKFLYVVGGIFLLVSCTTNTLDDLQPVQVVVEEDEGDPELVTFEQVGPIFSNNCTICHSNPPQNGAPMPLVTFENVRDAVENRGLIDRISRQEGAPGLMPLGGPRLPQQSIDLVSQWEEDGLLEN